MTRKQKILLGFGIYLGVAVVLYLVFGSDGKNEEFKPQDEFKLDPWIEIKIGGLDLSFNKAVLYLLLGLRAHHRDDGLHRPAHDSRSPTARRRSSKAPTT